MDPSPSPPSPPSTSSDPPPQQAAEKEMLHKTKAIPFFGRTTPIILQNDNGPCPLLAICNILSLKSSLNLNPDISEVSQEKLLSLVAERLIDSNSNIDNKDAGYVENQQQNIADAIDLLPRLTTGIDVNIKFRRIDDFEFTPECAIFDLLDIPLYHGWIVDPQDSETADAIGSKSYNTLMGELVSLETQAMESEQNNNLEDDDVDFVAATTAALGVPSPCLSRGQSFTDSPQRAKKGDMEENAELLRVLKLSEAERPSLTMDAVVLDVGSAHMAMSEIVVHSEIREKNVADKSVKTGALISDEMNGLSNLSVDTKTGAFISDDSFALSNLSVDNNIPAVFTQEAVCSFPKTDPENNSVQHTSKESKNTFESAVKNTGCDPGIQNGKLVSFGEDPPSSNNFLDKSRSDEHVENAFTSTLDLDERRNLPNDCKTGDSPSLLTASADLNSSRGQVHNVDKPEVFTSSIDVSEPIYEGEECIMESGSVVYENQEPIYEGEVVLAEQVDRVSVSDRDSKDRISVTQGELIKNFMKTSASQLTVYGLFCLQDKVKERELCVFFRNNHFNTMFKYEGELYILATDQGYINQPELVWEKLNEVNGDTVYVMGNFKDFKVDEHSNGMWDEQNAMANTADYLASIDSVAQSGSSFNSDLQLAIALQQQEFEQQQSQHNLPQPTFGGTGLITGPQVSHNSGKYVPSSSSPKQDSKSKERCIVM